MCVCDCEKAAEKSRAALVDIPSLTQVRTR